MGLLHPVKNTTYTGFAMTFFLGADMNRPSWDKYFMKIARVVSERSTCRRRGVGAIIVLSKRIIATGYNGAVSGLEHCETTGCMREKLKIPSGKSPELCRGLHAEQNALLFAARAGIDMEGGVLYSTHQPCILCAKMIIQAGIKKVVFEGTYPDRLARDLFREAKIKLVRYREKRR